MAKKERKYDAKYFIKVIIGFIIVWCFGLLPAPEPMTAVGMRLIGIFFGTIWLFSFAGVIWPSIMAVLAVGYSGAFPSLSAAITAAFGNTILWQLLILMPICEAISRSGATQKIAAWLLSRPFNYYLLCGTDDLPGEKRNRCCPQRIWRQWNLRRSRCAS